MGDGTILLTGGNSGLGLECAKVLARAPGDRHIVIASRDGGASARAIESLHGSGATHIEARRLDLGELADARRSAEALCADLEADRLPPLRVAIFNAGLQFNARERSKDGFEATFAVNHLGHFLLTQLLIGAFEAPARIIFVSSGTHDPDQRTGMPEPIPRPAAELADADADTGDDEGTFGRRAYTTSKLCNVLCAYELSRRLENSGCSRPEAPITVNAFDPGLMPGTGLARSYAGWQKMIWNSLFRALRVLPNVNSAVASGEALARLALDPELEGVTRKYFVGRRIAPSSKASYDEDLAKRLWEESGELIGLTTTF